jgi:hypothetical protein
MLQWLSSPHFPNVNNCLKLNDLPPVVHKESNYLIIVRSILGMYFKKTQKNGWIISRIHDTSGFFRFVKKIILITLIRKLF